jgi:hypothetical protein
MNVHRRFEPDLTFDGICSGLQHKDPSVTEVFVRSNEFPSSVPLTNANARRLGEAIQGNPHVTSIKLNLSDFVDVADDSDSAALLLQFIRESTSLKDVDLSLHDLMNHNRTILSVNIAHRFLVAIAESATIKRLKLYLFMVDKTGFDVLMKTTQSLKELVIRYGYFGSVASKEMAAKALGANVTLESLQIEIPNDLEMVHLIMLRLGAHPCLRELTLSSSRSDLGRVGTVALFLRTTRTLEHLRLDSYRFNKRSLESILVGIHGNDSLTKLTVDHCEFDSDSIFFQDLLKPKNGQNTLRELYLMRNEFCDQFPIGTVVTNILSPKQVDDDNGSKKDEIISLDALTMTGYHDDNMQSIFDILGNKATSIQLRCFRYENWFLENLTVCDALAACLPKLIHLKELAIPNHALVRSPVHKVRLLRAMKQNWSLQDVKITTNDGDERWFTDNDLYRMKLYSKRNHSIPCLFASARLGDNDKTDRCLFPKLFRAAKQAPRFAPNAMLMGLLALGDTVGSQNGGKSIVSSDSVVST